MPTRKHTVKKIEQISDSEDETFHDLLNLRDQNKVIHEYKLKKPQPTIEELAVKYKVSTKHISFIIKNQLAILKSEKTSDVDANIEESARLLLRSAQIKFLDMVMYEYLQRALYYSVHINEEIFKNKTEEVVDCMALMYFKDHSNFIDHFKSLYGLREIKRKYLLEDMELNEEKPSSLDPGDMVRYVQRHKAQYIAAQRKKERIRTTEKPRVYRNQTNNSNSRARRNHSPAVSYEPSEEEEQQNDSEDKNDSEEDTNDFEHRNNRRVMKIEFSPSRLSEETTMPQPRSRTIKEKTKSIPKPTSTDQRMETLQNTNDIDVRQHKRFKTAASDEDDNLLTNHKPEEDYDDSKEDTLSQIKTEREDNLSIKIEVLSNDYRPMETYEVRQKPSSPVNDMNIKTEETPPPASPEIQQPAEEDVPTALTNGTSDNPRKRSPTSPVPLREIDTLDEAVRSLRALENYALLKENCRAIGLLTQLEETLKKPPKQ